jgi:predicted ATPase
VGFGVSQILPILVEGIGRSKYSARKISGKSSKGGVSKKLMTLLSQTICVEQPEIHLHPRLQAELADFFIDTSVPRARNMGPELGRPVQWVLETHSELLMLRLKKRIREGRIRKEDVSVLYVEPKGRFGSEVIKLRIDDDGEFLDLWPSGFFVESTSEME